MAPKQMAQVSLAQTFIDELPGLDRGLQRKVSDFVDKLRRDHTSPGLNVERYNASADPRSRTARVDKGVRAILAAMGGHAYIVVKVLSHDDADRWMASNHFSVNQLTGAAEVVDVTAIEALASPAPAASVAADSALAGVPDKSFTQLGITDATVIAAARLMISAEQVELLAGVLPPDQSAALTGLAIGMTVDEIYADLVAGLETDGPPPDPDDLAAAVRRPASRSAFLVLDDDQSLADVLSGDFAAWQVFLHPSQRAVVEHRYSGPARVTGGAGTGKTVALLHRARRLALQSAGERPRVLVTTFTTRLQADLLDRLGALGGPELLKRVDVTTVDAFARRTLDATAARAEMKVIGNRELASLWQTIGRAHAPQLRPEFLAREWENVVLAKGIRTPDEYYGVARSGRGRPLYRTDRAKVWPALEAFQRELQERGKCTFLQLAATAAAQLEASATKPYDHVLIDEAQDLHPTQWHLLRAAVARGPDDLFIAGDAHQRIYDHRVSLSSLGIETRGRSVRLVVNYRTTHEILRWSIGLLDGQSFDDLDGGRDTLAGYRSVTHGDPPTLSGHATRDQELDALAQQLRAWQEAGIEPAEIGVCARTRNAAEQADQHLQHSGVLPLDPARGRPFVATMHAMKGLEFRAVAMIDISATSVPPPAAVTSRHDDPTHHARDIQRERCLLYVAATRAREVLAVSWAGDPSPLIPGEPSERP